MLLTGSTLHQGIPPSVGCGQGQGTRQLFLVPLPARSDPVCYVHAFCVPLWWGQHHICPQAVRKVMWSLPFPFPKGGARVGECRNSLQPSQLRSVYGNNAFEVFFGFGRYSPGASLLRASPQCPSEKDLGSISTHRCWQYWKAKMGEEKEVKLLRQLERKCRILWEGRSACTVGGMEPFRFPPSGRKIEATVNLKVN